MFLDLTLQEPSPLENKAMDHACQPSQALQACSSFRVSCAWLPCLVAGLQQLRKGPLFYRSDLDWANQILIAWDEDDETGKQDTRATKERKKSGRKSSHQKLRGLYYRSYMGVGQSQRKKRKVTLLPVSALVSLKTRKTQITEAHWGCLRIWFGFHFKVMLTA